MKRQSALNSHRIQPALDYGTDKVTICGKHNLISFKHGFKPLQVAIVQLCTCAICPAFPKLQIQTSCCIALHSYSSWISVTYKLLTISSLQYGFIANSSVVSTASHNTCDIFRGIVAPQYTMNELSDTGIAAVGITIMLSFRGIAAHYSRPLYQSSLLLQSLPFGHRISKLRSFKPSKVKYPVNKRAIDNDRW